MALDILLYCLAVLAVVYIAFLLNMIFRLRKIMKDADK